MDVQKIIIATGLTEKEAIIYLMLLKLKEALPSTLARKTEIKRPTTYVILEQLKKKGFVSYVTKGKYTYYQAINPYAFLEIQHKKYSDVEKVLPELLQLHQMYAITPEVKIFEGKEGLIHIMEDTLSSSTELHTWADVSQSVHSVLQDYYPTYIKKKVERELWVRGVVADDPLARKFKERGAIELRELYLVPKNEYPFENEINIYDDKVSIISHKDSIGIIIQNKNIANTQRTIHKLTFNYAKLLEKESSSMEHAK